MAYDGNPSLESLDEPKAAKGTILEAGTAVPIVGGFGFQPQLAGYFGLPWSMQAGLVLRFSPGDAEEAYDQLPQASLQIRKLWIGDGAPGTIRNAEYLGLAAGGFFGYDFTGRKSGPEPFGSIGLGKYWAPFDGRPVGFDLNLELTRYFSALLPGRSVQVFITTGISLFYLLP